MVSKKGTNSAFLIDLIFLLLLNKNRVGVYMDVLLLAAILPIIGLCYFIYQKDVNKEPKELLVKIFLLGFFSAIPVVLFELFLDKVFPTDGIVDMGLLFVHVFISVALIEEGFKWMVTKFAGYNSKEFDEIYDIIVYSVFASLGFACIENIGYVASYGIVNAVVRAFLSVPGHMCFGVAMGYFLSRAKIGSVNNNNSIYIRNLVLSLLVPTLLHTVYDTLLFYADATSNYAFLVYFLIFHIITIIFCFKIVGSVSKVQQNFNTNVSNGTIVLNNTGVTVNVQPNNTAPAAEATIISSQAVQSPVINFCPVCGKPVRNTNFCSYCGYKLK